LESTDALRLEPSSQVSVARGTFLRNAPSVAGTVRRVAGAHDSLLPQLGEHVFPLSVSHETSGPQRGGAHPRGDSSDSQPESV